MFNKLFNWVKGLFSPLSIDEQKLDRYIRQASPGPGPVVFVEKKKDNINTFRGKKVEVQQKRSLDDRLKSADLPAFARNRTIPPSAKRKYIKETARARQAGSRPLSEGPSTQDIGNATLLYAAVASSSSDSQSRTGHSCSRGSDDNSGSHNSHSSHSSYSPGYDSGSSDSGSSSSSSCD